jgi:TRAP-type C4-dicarboxylate transport system permease large subunit
VILAASMASTNYLIDQEIPVKLFDFISRYIDSKYTFLLLLNVFLLIVGAVLDIFSALVLVVPLILPVALQYGVDPVHLGIVFLATMQLGYITPPVGLNLFIASYRFERPVMELYLSTLPFFCFLLISVLIIAFWPGLSLAFLN